MKRIKIRVALTSIQHAFLKELAEQKKQSASSILRQALSAYIESTSDTTSQEWLSLGGVPAEHLH